MSAIVGWGGALVVVLALPLLIIFSIQTLVAGLESSLAVSQPGTNYQLVTANNLAAGGLGRKDVPRLDGALRLDYQNNGTSQYATKATLAEVAGFYLLELPVWQWQLVSFSSPEIIWEKDGELLKIAVLESPIGGKTRVDYQIVSQVLGESFRAADEGTGSQPTTVCPAGQYLCNGACVPDGTRCASQPTPAGEPTPVAAPTCGQCQAVKDGQCVPAPAGTPDANCGEGGVCDQYGGCVRLGQGKTMVGEGAVCGDRMCDEARGENSGNCHDDCGSGVQRAPMEGGGYQPGPGGEQYQEGRQGPSEEELAKMDEQRFRDMKRGISQFSRGFKQMEKMIKRLEPKLKKLGVGIPEELKAAMAKAPEIIAKIEAAKTADELEELVADIQDIGETMQEWGPQIGELMRLGEMLKQASNKLKEVERAVKRVEGWFKKKPILHDAVSNLRSIAEAMKQALAEAKELAKTEPDSALEKLESEFFDRMEEFWNSYSEIEMMQNLTKGLAQAKKDLNNYGRKIKELERNKKADKELVAELKDLVNQAKEALAAVQALAKQKADFEEIKEAAEALWDLFETIENKLEEVGMGFYESTAKKGESVNFVLPDAFDFRMGPGPGEQSGPGGPGGPGFGGGGGQPTCNINGVEVPGRCEDLQGGAG